MNNFKRVTDLLSTGFDDYIAARHLLNNDFFIQGAILACTAVEKHIKACYCVVHPDKKVPWLHLDNLDELKAKFSGTEFENELKKFDEVFFKELGTIYKFRYYDNLKTPTSIGFLINQFLGELDFSITHINQLINIKSEGNKPFVKKIDREVLQFNRTLLDNNYVVLGIHKEEFMNRETHGYSLYVNPDKPNAEGRTQFKVVPGNNIKWADGVYKTLPKYDGNILPFRMNYNTD